MTSITIIISGSKLFKNGGQLDNSTLKSQLLIPLVLIKRNTDSSGGARRRANGDFTRRASSSDLTAPGREHGIT